MQTNLLQVAEAICRKHGFTLVDRVGFGAFKETFHIVLENGEPQALKVFRQQNTSERTEREIAAMRRCMHKNIATLGSIDLIEHQQQNFLYITEEYLSGGSLSNLLRNGLLSVMQVVSLGIELIPAVAHIASLDLVHRDLKPDNIMFREDGTTPVIVDFGLVRDLATTSITQTWALSGPGTPYYAAPEQLRNEKEMIDWRTDQFALGIVFSEIAFGFHPFAMAGDDDISTIDNVSERRGPSERFVRETTAAGLTVLSRMVAPWPVQRYRVPGELLASWVQQAGNGA